MNNDNDIFEYATRNKIRFESARGSLSVEQLWDAPLRSNDDFNLNAIARSANKVLKDATEESFVSAGVRTAAHVRLERTLDVVKRVIEVKLGDEADAKRRAENKKEREELLAILADKEKGKLSELSVKELQKRIAALEV
jgi:uncharacterized small protein (DUF1192 family)